MVEKGTNCPVDQQIAAALAEKLDGVTPRRDLWRSILAEVQRRQQRHRKWWQLPPFGPLVMVGGRAPALRLTGISLASVAVVLLLAWLVLLPPGQNPSQDLLARNVRGYWYDNASGPVADSGAVSYAAFFESTGDNPIINTSHNYLCSFGVAVDTLSYGESRDLVLNAGRLPDPASVRLEGFINSFDHGYRPPTEGLFAIHIEAAPSPFGGENDWLLRIGLQARTAGAVVSPPDSPAMPPVIARNVKASVDFDPEVVSSYRQLGYEYQRVPHDDYPTSTLVAEEVRAGHSVTALFEVRFREGAQGRAATVHTKYQDPDTDAEKELTREFNSSGFGLTIEETTPYFQRDAVVAEYAEILRQSHWAQGSSLKQAGEIAERVSRLLHDDQDMADFTRLLALTSRLSPAPPS
jgi:hypothetical protein